ncbi:hypothetical protein HPP92_027625 [Vanilla planifolia]|uniref:Uncharacterized protein n=1 Tax=Vanilla planifolia TaxID=51239 RepID=A0A835PB60_VANPL|nr:hypothetical protein HPP92_027625 [Vanilla planifolia]
MVKESETGTTIMDEMDLFGEQVKMLAGEIALSEQMQKLRDEINEKKVQMRLLEKRMIESFDDAPH